MKLKIILALISIFFIFSCVSDSKGENQKTPVKSANLTNTSWKLKNRTGVNLEQIYSDKKLKNGITLKFSSEGMSGHSGINTYSAEYKLKGNGISFTPITVSLMAGDIDLMDLESKYLEQLQNVKSYELKGNTLILKTGNGALTFEKVE